MSPLEGNMPSCLGTRQVWNFHFSEPENTCSQNTATPECIRTTHQTQLPYTFSNFDKMTDASCGSKHHDTACSSSQPNYSQQVCRAVQDVVLLTKKKRLQDLSCSFLFNLVLQAPCDT